MSKNNELETQVYQAIGAASVCWEHGEVPTGTFDEKQAHLIADNLISYIEDNFATEDDTEYDTELFALRLSVLNVCNGDLTQARVAFDWITDTTPQTPFEDHSTEN